MTIKTVCIVGPGAIGGMLAVHLEMAGFTVSALARPARAQAINGRGLTLHEAGQTYRGSPRAATRGAELGPQDLVVVTLKGTGLREIAPELAALCKPTTPIVFIMNGVPWWFFDGFGGALAGTTLRSLDADGFLARTISTPRIVWGVINCGVGEDPDGSIRHAFSKQIQLGRPDGSMAGLEEIADVFRAATYETTALARIRDAIWVKLLANVTMNPVSALTMATTNLILQDPLVLDLVIAIAKETWGLGATLGLDPGPHPATRLRQAAPTLGASKTSMLQDVERGRTLELDGLIAAAVEIGDLVHLPMPHTKAILGLIRLRSATLGAAVP